RRSGGCVLNPLDLDLSLRNVEKRLALAHADRSITSGCTEECLEIAGELGCEMQHAVDRAVPGAPQPAQQPLAPPAAPVPTSAFGFAEGVAVSAVVAPACGAHDREALFHMAVTDEVACHLVLDACPDFVAVREGERQCSAFGPRAEQEPALRGQRIARTLGVG